MSRVRHRGLSWKEDPQAGGVGARAGRGAGLAGGQGGSGSISSLPCGLSGVGMCQRRLGAGPASELGRTELRLRSGTYDFVGSVSRTSGPENY